MAYQARTISVQKMSAELKEQKDPSMVNITSNPHWRRNFNLALDVLKGTKGEPQSTIRLSAIGTAINYAATIANILDREGFCKLNEVVTKQEPLLMKENDRAMPRIVFTLNKNPNFDKLYEDDMASRNQRKSINVENKD